MDYTITALNTIYKKSLKYFELHYISQVFQRPWVHLVGSQAWARFTQWSLGEDAGGVLDVQTGDEHAAFVHLLPPVQHMAAYGRWQVRDMGTTCYKNPGERMLQYQKSWCCIYVKRNGTDAAKISLEYLVLGEFCPRLRWGKLTVAQATVSCISLRFSCQKDYLDMLQMLGTRLALGVLEAWGAKHLRITGSLS